jgi:hypothetical protein
MVWGNSSLQPNPKLARPVNNSSDGFPLSMPTAKLSPTSKDNMPKILDHIIGRQRTEETLIPHSQLFSTVPGVSNVVSPVVESISFAD